MARPGGPRVLVALPCYNEEKALPSLLRKLDALAAAAGPEVRFLLVDDGSRDGTPDLLAGYAAGRGDTEVIRHPVNLGLGAAVRTILEYAATHLEDDDVLVTMDGDDTHDPAMVPDMVAKLDREGLDLVVASRYAPGAGEFGLGLHRRLLSRGASLFLRLFFPIPGVRDYSSGYRAYRVALIRRAMRRWPSLVTTSGFDCMAELMAKISRLEPQGGEHPLILRYDRKQGRTKMRVLRTIRGYFRLLKEAG